MHSLTIVAFALNLRNAKITAIPEGYMVQLSDIDVEYTV